MSGDTVLVNIYKALLSVQENCLYRDKNEDIITDRIRDRLKMIYNVSDQSRCGFSTIGKDAGEVDLKISDNGWRLAYIV